MTDTRSRPGRDDLRGQPADTPEPSAHTDVLPDVVFSNGTIVDGLGGPARLGDVAIANDIIVAVRAPGSLSGGKIIDCTGKIVAPGFVDIHSHADFTLYADGRAQSAVAQGITTIVPGNCGHGIAPLSDEFREVAMLDMAVRVDRVDMSDEWTTFAGYLDVLRGRGVGVNVFPLVAHGALRRSICGNSERELTRSELDQLRGLASDAMEAGAIGLSTGLEYLPGTAATQGEIAEIAKSVGEHNGLYASHCRNRAENMVDAAREALYIASTGGCRLQLSHFVRRPTGPAGDVARAARELVLDADKAIAGHFDVFPFDYGPTPLSFMLPAWSRQGSLEETADRLSQRYVQKRILEDLNPRFVATLESGIAESMYVASDGTDETYAGMSLGEIARTLDIGVADAGLFLLVRAGTSYPAVVIVERWADWTDLLESVADKHFFIMGDGVTSALDGPLANYAFSLADWGYAPEMLGRMVRDLNVCTLEDAIVRMTSAPAQQIGLADRGHITAGAKADLVVFDLTTIGSGITADNLVVSPRGIDHVVVNGTFAVHSGQAKDTLSGTVGLT